MLEADVAMRGRRNGKPLRPLPQPGDVPHHRPAGQRHRLWRARAGGGRRGQSTSTPATPSAFKKSRNLFALNFAKVSKRPGLDSRPRATWTSSPCTRRDLTTPWPPWAPRSTDEQARLIAQYADKVILAYDSDEAGTGRHQAGHRPILTRSGVKVRVLTIPEGAKDPDEFIKKYGAERF